MADLINLLDHKKNTRVSVNGNTYEIGADGVVKGVKDTDATKLLQNERVWKKYDPKRAAAQRAQAKAAHKGKMQLLDVNGNPVDNLPPDKPGPTMDPMEEVYKRPDPKVQNSEGPPPVPESVEAEEPEPEEEEPEDVGDEEEEVEEEEAEEEEAEADGEWPDPKESMAIDYLREMAEAYEVEFTSRTSKKTLVKRISAAMYE